MKRELPIETRRVLKAAGRCGADACTPNPGPANIAQLVRLGALVDEHGALIDCKETAKARRARAHRATLARQQQAKARKDAQARKAARP